MRHVLFSLLITMLIAVTGCSETINEPADNAASATLVNPNHYDENRLGPPAYARPFELKKGGKADQFFDIRKKNPEYYAITEHTKIPNWRHMVEWEEMQAMVLQLANYVPNNAELKTMYVEMVKEAAEVGEVWAIYPADTIKTAMEPAFSDGGVKMANVEWIKMPSESIWLIDYGPLPLINEDDNSIGFIDWKYYNYRAYDDAVSTRLGQLKGVTTYRQELGFEGGNFQGDGKGNCYTTTRALKYTGLSEEAIGAALKVYTNCQKTHVVKDVTDDGTGHIDMFFKLTSAGEAIMGDYPVGMEDALPTPLKTAKDQAGNAVTDIIATNRKRMNDNVDLLEAITLADGTKMKVYRVDMPGYGYDKQQKGWTLLPFTYINSTFINGKNLVPVYSFSEWSDSKAKAMFQWKAAMPDMEHVGIIADEVALASGAIHCITRTIPKGTFKKWIGDGTCTSDACVPPAEFSDLGHVGACVDDTTCFGPKWLCECNDCSPGGCDEPEKPADECDGISFEGCCEGDTLQYCENGQLSGGACDPGTCGWEAAGNGGNGWYNCNQTGQEDPSGTFPKDCNGAGTTGSSTGSSTGATTGPGPEPDCAGKVCGPDGAGGNCGMCAAGQECVEGQCVETKTCTDECSAQDIGCDGNTPWSCAFDQTVGCTYKKPDTECAAGTVCQNGGCVAGGTTGAATGAATGGATGTDTGVSIPQCQAGEILQVVNGELVCVTPAPGQAPVAVPTCAPGQIIVIDANNQLVCSNPAPAPNINQCAPGQIVIQDPVTGQLGCANPGADQTAGGSAGGCITGSQPGQNSAPTSGVLLMLTIMGLAVVRQKGLI